MSKFKHTHTHTHIGRQIRFNNGGVANINGESGDRWLLQGGRTAKKSNEGVT